MYTPYHEVSPMSHILQELFIQNYIILTNDFEVSGLT